MWWSIVLLQFYSDINQIYVRETKHRDTLEGVTILILCCLEPLQIVHNYSMIGTFFSKLHVIKAQALLCRLGSQ